MLDIPDNLWGVVAPGMSDNGEPRGTLEHLVNPYEEFVPTFQADPEFFDRLFQDYPRVLSIDPSMKATGIFTTTHGSYTLSALDYDKSSLHAEVELRRDFKQSLLDSLGSHKDFDIIIIEDAFVGRSYTTARKLYAINTGIDELLLDDEVHTDKFVRVSNGAWKGYLSKVIGHEYLKGLPDKQRVATALSYLGIYNDSQDILDATGMAIGVVSNLQDTPTKSVVTWKSLDVTIADSLEDLLDCFDPDRVSSFIEHPWEHVSPPWVLNALSLEPTAVVYTTVPVRLGTLVLEDYDRSRGYFTAFHRRGAFK